MYVNRIVYYKLRFFILVVACIARKIQYELTDISKLKMSQKTKKIRIENYISGLVRGLKNKLTYSEQLCELVTVFVFFISYLLQYQTVYREKELEPQVKENDDIPMHFNDDTM